MGDAQGPPHNREATYTGLPDGLPPNPVLWEQTPELESWEAVPHGLGEEASEKTPRTFRSPHTPQTPVCTHMPHTQDTSQVCIHTCRHIKRDLYGGTCMRQ